MNLERYKRQLLVPELGTQGQQILSKKHAVIIGGGGLGSHSAEILVRMGIGHLDIYDPDSIEETNLHRTAIFTEHDIGKPKTQVLEEKLSSINSQVSVQGFQKELTPHTILSLPKKVDIIIDGTDNLTTRFLLNEYCVKHRIPWVYAGVNSTIGMILGIVPTQTPCLKCISHDIPGESSQVLPVLGVLPRTIASIQTTEAIKILLGQPPAGLIIYNIWSQQFEHLSIHRNNNCCCCGTQHFEFLKEK